MKKKYIKPEIAVGSIVAETILSGSNVSSEGMGSNETPGDDDDFNSSERDKWGSLW